MAASYLCIDSQGDLEIWTQEPLYWFDEQYEEYPSHWRRPRARKGIAKRKAYYAGISFFVEYLDYESGAVVVDRIGELPSNYDRIVLDAWSDMPTEKNYYKDFDLKYV